MGKLFVINYLKEFLFEDFAQLVYVYSEMCAYYIYIYMYIYIYIFMYVRMYECWNVYMYCGVMNSCFSSQSSSNLEYFSKQTSFLFIT